jgi:hypothetical protein
MCLAALYLAPYFYPHVNLDGEVVVRNSLGDSNFDIRLAYVKAWLFRFYLVRFGFWWVFVGAFIREVYVLPKHKSPRLWFVRAAATFAFAYICKEIFLSPTGSFLLYLYFFGI